MGIAAVILSNVNDGIKSFGKNSKMPLPLPRFGFMMDKITKVFTAFNIYG